MAENTFEDLLREDDDISGAFELDELIGGLDGHPDCDLDFDDENYLA